MMRTLVISALLATATAYPAIAQDTAVTSPLSTTAERNAPSLMLTEEQTKVWIDKTVYSSNGIRIGGVGAIARGTDNAVTEMHADIGGYLGIGETRIRLAQAQFKLQDDRVTLSVTGEDPANNQEVRFPYLGCGFQPLPRDLNQPEKPLWDWTNGCRP